MNFLQSGMELLGDVGFGVIKNSGRILYGTGQAVLGAVSEDDELVEKGVKNLSGGAIGLTFHTAKKLIGENNNEDEVNNNDTDLDSYA